jgi:hypothetical protein
LIVIALFAMGCGADKSGVPKPAPFVHFVPNSHAFWSNPDNWTTDFGPAYANILLDGATFCRAAAARSHSAITQAPAPGRRICPAL